MFGWVNKAAQRFARVPSQRLQLLSAHGSRARGCGQRPPNPWQGLHSRGQRANVFVAAEGEADSRKGSALVEHFGDLGGQVIGGDHQDFAEVACPGCGLLLRSGSKGERWE